MDTLLFCGGKGTRLDADVEKPLFEVGGVPMVDRVLDALDGSRAGEVYPVVSPHAPATREHLADRERIDAPGGGYVADLEFALADDRVGTPVLTVAADLPLLAPSAVNAVLGVHDDGSLAVYVPASLKRDLGASVDTTFEEGGRDLAPTGANVVGDGRDETYVTADRRLAVNVNRKRDAAVAEAWL
ncbi:MAG: NTP transferase domain-containing protein [Haloarculaceae archaeon]